MWCEWNLWVLDSCLIGLTCRSISDCCGGEHKNSSSLLVGGWILDLLVFMSIFLLSVMYSFFGRSRLLLICELHSNEVSFRVVECVCFYYYFFIWKLLSLMCSSGIVLVWTLLPSMNNQQWVFLLKYYCCCCCKSMCRVC